MFTKNRVVRVVVSVVAVAALVGFASVALASPITFTGADFGDTAQLNTTGTFIEAVNFCSVTTVAPVVANGISFVQKLAQNPTNHLAIGGALTGDLSTAFYIPTTHKTGYTSIVGLSESDATNLLTPTGYGVGTTCTLTGLTVGHDYVFQILTVDDRSTQTGQTIMFSNVNNDWPNSLTLDHTRNAVQLVTGEFTAGAETQVFYTKVSNSANVRALGAYQLRDVTVPEPGTLALLATALFGLLCYAWRRRR